MKPPTINYLTNIYFEPGIVSCLPELLEQLSSSRPLVVTDRGLTEAGLVDRLNLSPCIAFDNVPGNPTEECVLAGLAVYRENDCDGVVALGGGSPIDCAKAIAVLATHSEPLENYAFLRGGLPKITADKPPLIAIPTTAGTGSEVGRGSMITFSSGPKLALISPFLIPEAAVCDPELTLGLPPMLTAATGMDAISHCVETFCSPKFNPVAEAIAIDGLDRACRFLRTAVEDGSHLIARTEMLIAATEGALTFQKGLGLIHSLSHPLGSLRDKRLHHGTLNSIFLPHVLRFNAAACPEKMDRMAKVAGAKNGDQLPEHFAAFASEMGLPSRLSELGVTREECEPLAILAQQDHCTASNPRPATVEECMTLFEAAL